MTKSLRDQIDTTRDQYLAADAAGDHTKAAKLAARYGRLVKRLGRDPYL